ncbi:uncharacterized protein NFIA_089850 [Aspergillus fischeri NRRL 181]|uniref:Uncharacterized protein n=1 Tax=Neosartorya fischeri (strain ATCC 1020 / DSM 3700 / CBS 544.65 / FGSC A1164 / JCM 1740 / NRRL 181 / WB 181) TaxID=331117 RepID=A1DI20_NEOFI|nr:uncharacterized protein NFIA_089850 [Aspergillus fischeri NRRL 181]EAW19027.1 hypothetical protein NFIA_089850 [Aspergillus fischeri NRRL 181]KAG2021427.1 hypothetical protein GB937_004764 [Aspergillus fischeri]
MLVPQYHVKNSTIRIVPKSQQTLGYCPRLSSQVWARVRFKAVRFGPLSVGNPDGVGALVGANLNSYASRISYAVAVNDEDPDTRLVAVTAKAACDDIFAGLQIAETFTAYA